MSIETLENLAKSRFDHALHRKAMKERLEQQLVVAHGGGVFKATPELICFVTICKEETIYLEDVYGNPVRCERESLLVKLHESYQCAMNAWHQEFENMKTVRKGADV